MTGAEKALTVKRGEAKRGRLERDKERLGREDGRRGEMELIG